MSVVDTLVKCRKYYVTCVSERDINDAGFGLLEEIDDAIQEAEEKDSVIKSINVAIDMLIKDSKEKCDIIKSLKIANEEKDRVSKKIISDDVEKRMRGGSE